MKSNKFLTLLGAGLMMLTSTTACTDGYEKEPVELFTLDYLFSTTDSVGDQATYLLSRIYNNTKRGHSRVGSDYLDAASDDAISLFGDESQVYKLAMGQYTAISPISAENPWADYYKAFREINYMINNVHVVPFKDTYVNANGESVPLNATYIAESRFLRAYFYFELVKRYGGVPLIGDRVFELGENLELPRNTFEECINYIVSELDAIKYDLRKLPMDNPTAFAHAPTIQACEALKAHVLLYAASPLFNESPIEPGNELIGYKSYDASRWQKAADAAKAVIDTYGPNGDGSLGLAKDFRQLFLSFYSVSDNPELIWFIQDDTGTQIEKNHGPLGYTGNAMGAGRTLPTQNLVESFPMKDGKMPGTSTKYPYTLETQYANRDPRMEYTVIHNGMNWLSRPIATYLNGANNPTSSTRSCITSYYMCKFMGKYQDNGATEYASQPHLWIVLRYAEVLLNYAEALNETLGAPNSDVYDQLIALRKRAGIEAGDDNLYGLKAGMSKEEMRKVIRNERRIEMAFEEQRYFDIRRWKIAGEVFENPLRGEQITNAAGVLSFQTVPVQSVKWEDRRYFAPIPYSEKIKNSNMKQNPNW